ncbi:MAG: universal stress protein [Thermoanaerobaculia bacterium]
MSGEDPGPIRSILVATDFSDTSQAGVDWAVEIARAHGARIFLVHGLLLPGRTTDFAPSPPDFTEALQEAASGRLNESAEKVRASGIKVATDLRLGLPSQAILEAAEKDAVDLVVLGTRGLSGIRHLLLGSTAQRVVQHARCPVLTVHPGDIDQHRRIRTILVPTDFSRDTESSLGAARDLLADGKDAAKIILLHVYHLPFEYTAYGTIPTSVDFYKDVQGSAEERLAEMAEPLRQAGWRIETAAREGYPPEVIVEEAEGLGADLIALGTHGRSGLAHLLLGSTAERVVQHARCPVLTVRRPKD